MTHNLTIHQQSAVRHIVYADLLMTLPIASADQVGQFVANLNLAKSDLPYGSLALAKHRSAIACRYLNLRVTPDIAEATRYSTPTVALVERMMAGSYGDMLDFVPGFYRRSGGDGWRLALPRGCALHGYAKAGHYAGILCQPLGELDRYFLLSSAKYGGPRAIPLSAEDRVSFDRPAETEPRVMDPAFEAEMRNAARSYGRRSGRR